MEQQRIAILGATGSIGKQTLEIVDNLPETLSVEVLTADKNWEQLAESALKYGANSVVIADKSYYKVLKDRLWNSDIKVYAGDESVEQIVESSEIDSVVSAIVGYAGLKPTVNAIKHNKKIALANKETLVVAGELVMKLAADNRVPILPVDSEHSAIFQSLVGEFSEIDKILLTASGGPFFGYTKEMLEDVTVERALRHPNWTMGRKITIDSATLMNKGLEVIEAAWLFGVSVDDIEVLVHQSSIVHSMVQFKDGAIKAQLGTPDMKLPIQYALTYPERVPLNGKRLNMFDSILEFKRPDSKVFRCLDIAYNAMRKGGNIACAMNAANEVAVDKFLNGKIGFLDIATLVEKTIETIEDTTFIKVPTLDDYHNTDKLAREIANNKIII